MALVIEKLEKKFDKRTIFNKLDVTFPTMGFISILGRSGCGKSTLLHCIANLEKPDSGNIYLGKDKVNKFKEKRKEEYLNKDISLVFQHYQLIEDQPIVFNASLPMLIAGERKEFAYKRALELLKEVGFDSEKSKKLVNTCSGGEKQRVALVRSIINNPKIILADEPTGALDTANSRAVMEILKKFSKKHLVIVVTHNRDLAYEFSDRVLLMDSSSIKTVTLKEIPKEEIYNTPTHTKRNGNWVTYFVEKNLKKRFKRNLISIISLAVSLIFTFVLFGFINGSGKEISAQSVQQFDLGVSTISIQNKTEIENSKLKLVQETRLSPLEISEFVSTYPIFEYGLNYDYLISPYIDITFGDEKEENFSFNPVYSFEDESCPDFLTVGELPKDNLEEVLINDKGYEYLKKKYRGNPLDLSFTFETKREITTYLDREDKPYIVDYFEFKKTMRIVGVVKETSFLNTPKFYYSFKALDEYMSFYLMNNLSKEYQTDFSYKMKLDQCSASDPLCSYSYRIFLKDYRNFKEFEKLEIDKYQITNNSLKVREAITSFIDAATMGMELFLAIAIMGSVFILGITSFSSYSQDQHSNAILLALGAKRDDVFSIYIFESLILGMISFFISLAFSMCISPLINMALAHWTGFTNLVQIPIKSFMNKRFFLPIMMFSITLFVSLVSSYIPMVCSKKTSLSKELKEE